MKKIILLTCIFISMNVLAQKMVELPYEENAAVTWSTAEREYYSDIWENEVVTNVAIPRLEVFEADQPNGTSIIVAPGGGLYGLSIESEGRAVAKWLNEKGITAFVLKYRLVPTGVDGIKEITDEGATNPAKIGE